MAEVKLNLLLVGRTGQGMSATGNTLLDREAFRTSSNSNSKTSATSYNFREFENYALLVVDAPGLGDTDLNRADGKIAAATNMDTALAICYGGVDAFLLVIKFGNKYTEEDKEALVTLEKIFGNTFMRHVIVVVTCGDLFQICMNRDTRSFSFQEWCKEQHGAFRDLYDHCEGRCVLFNNMETDEEMKRTQFLQLAEIAHTMQASNERYTSNSFKMVQLEREKWILEIKSPRIALELGEEVSILASELDALFNCPSSDLTVKIRGRFNKLSMAIMKHDRGFGILPELVELLKCVEEKLDCAEKFDSLSKQLKEIRSTKSPAEVIAEALSFGAVGFVATLMTGNNLATLSPKEKKIVMQIDEIKKKWTKLMERR